MSWVAAAVGTTIAASTLYQERQQRIAAKKAKKDVIRDRNRARKAEVFAETEGQGIGDLGEVQLGIDEEIDEEEELRKGKSSSLSI